MSSRTKFIATIGPASDSEETLRDLIRAGMDVARLGLAHNTIDQAAERMANIRRIAELEDRYVGILVDLPGPNVRAAAFGEAAVTITGGAGVAGWGRARAPVRVGRVGGAPAHQSAQIGSKSTSGAKSREGSSALRERPC